MSLGGRNERRFRVAIAVHLLSREEPRRTEGSVTENVSPCGARVLSKRRWQPGERLWITPAANEFLEEARVIYCEHGSGEEFSIGLKLAESLSDWWESPMVSRKSSR
jgi:hypothetical protein